MTNETTDGDAATPSRTDDARRVEHARLIERIRAERRAAGKSETITSPDAYALLASALATVGGTP